jgi:DNA-binding response OmpR family regulator
MYNFLVVDDEEDIREIIKMALEDEFECNIDIAVDGLDAFLLAREKRYDLMTVDFIMPYLDGLGFVEALKSKDNKCKKSGILMISGRIDEVENYGNLLFFEKPFKMNKIVSFAKYLLSK